MLDARNIVRDALAGVPSSLLDDPTAYEFDPPSRNDVVRSIVNVANENVTSALARAFGLESERIATAMDAAITEDGPLADLDAIWNAEITGTRVEPKLQPVLDAPDWEGRVEALRIAMAAVVENEIAFTARATLGADAVDRVIELDPRLAHLRDADFTPPAFLTRDEAPGESGEHPEQPVEFEIRDGKIVDPDETIVWDDEPSDLQVDELPAGQPSDLQVDEWADDEPAAPEPVTRGRGRRVDASVPVLCGLLEAAGFTDKLVAEQLGINKSYYSLIRSGKRPWQGLRDDQADKLAAELRGRADAVAEALVALTTPEVRRADTP